MIIPYNTFNYLYPPRPEHKTPPSELPKFDTGEYIVQPKYNGTCCIVFTNREDAYVYNRHKQELSNCSKDIDFKGLAQSRDWYVYCGEYLNKGKLGESGEKEKGKFIIWDILVYCGEYLVGETLESRLNLLEGVFPCQRGAVTENGLEMYSHLCNTSLKGIYKAPTYLNNFERIYNDIVKTDLYEGLVIKKLNSKLEFGFQELNNQNWQIKCRKPTKIYHF